MAIQEESLIPVEPFFADDITESDIPIFTGGESLTSNLRFELITTENIDQSPMPSLEIANAFVDFMGHYQTTQKMARWRRIFNITGLVHIDNLLGEPMDSEHITRMTDRGHDKVLEDWESFSICNGLVKTVPDPRVRPQAYGFASMDQVEAGMYRLVRAVLEERNLNVVEPALWISNEDIMDTMIDQRQLIMAVRAWFQLQPTPPKYEPIARERGLRRLRHKLSDQAARLRFHLGIIEVDGEGLIESEETSSDDSEAQEAAKITKRLYGRN